MSEQKASIGNINGGPPKQKKERSPAYPAISLQAAIERARQFYRVERRNSARPTIAVQHWGFSQASSGGRAIIASLLKFGLMEEEGRGEDRSVRLSRLALDIILDEQPISTERDQLIQRAALRPKIHAHLWEKYRHELPSEASLRTHLKRDLGFTDTAVTDLIDEYRDTIEFARLDSGAEFSQTGSGGEGELERPQVSVGDLVQWTDNGVDQFVEPRAVRGITDDGQWAFVDGSLTGIPTAELAVLKAAVDANKPNPTIASAPTPPQSPFATTTAPKVPTPSVNQVFANLLGFSSSTQIQEFPIPLKNGGRAVLAVPVPLDPTDFTLILKTMEMWKPVLVREYEQKPADADTDTDHR